MLYKENPSAYTRCEKCRHIDRENEECKVTNDKWLVCDDAGECRQFSQEGVNMKVVPIYDVMRCGKTVLRKGVPYEVLNRYNERVELKNDLGKTKTYPIDNFEIVEDYESVNTNNAMKFSSTNTGDKVMCIDRLNGSDLTVGKIYEVLEIIGIREDVIYIKVINNKGKKVSYASEFFEKVNDDELDVDLSSKYHIPTYDKETNIGVESNDSGNNNPIKPNHYKSGKFDVIAFCFEHKLGFALGNVVKYVVRAGKKDSSKELEDLLKAQEYLNREVERVKASE